MAGYLTTNRTQQDKKMAQDDLESEILIDLHGFKSRTLKEIKKHLTDYDAQEISEAINVLLKDGSIHSISKDGAIAYTVSEPEKITICKINAQVEEIKSKLKGIEISDIELKIAALKKIGEIMADDIQQLLNEICSDLSTAQSR